MRNGSMQWVAAAAWVLAAVGGCSAADGRGVRVYESTRKILTGPFQLRGPAPQQRLDQFKPVEYPCVYVENEYFRCCVLPTVGGRLYEVYNKASKSQVFFVNPYLETHADDFAGGHPWNLGGVEVNFPYFHHGNTYNDRWQWSKLRRADGSAGVMTAFTSRPTMQRAGFRVLLRPGVARVLLEYRFENLNPYPWGLAAWIDTMHPKTIDTQFILPSPWVAQHGHNRGRTDLKPWPVRKGVDISWQRNVKPKGDLSEFGFMPRQRFHGCYEHKLDRGAVRLFDPRTLPAAKLWTQAVPVSPERYYQHFEIWTATSAVMEDPGRQAELSCHRAADSWQQAWGIGGYVLANGDLSLNLARRKDGKLLAGVCGTRKLPDCTVSLREGHDTFLREAFDLDPARPWRRELPARAGDVVMDVLGPDGRELARYELRDPNELPKEQWVMPAEPRWAKGLNAAYSDEDYSVLWRRRGHFFDGAIRRYAELLKKQPRSPKLTLDLARSHLKDEQVRVGLAYRKPGKAADADAAKRRIADLDTAVPLLEDITKRDPGNARAWLYLGLARERQHKVADAAAALRAAIKAGRAAAPAAQMYLARHLLTRKPAEAAALAARAAKVYPQSTRAKHVLMAALTAAGKADQAAAIGREMLAIDPANPLTTRLLADACRAADNEADAKRFDGETRRLLAGDDAARKGLDADLAWLRAKP